MVGIFSMGIIEVFAMISLYDINSKCLPHNPDVIKLID